MIKDNGHLLKHRFSLLENNFCYIAILNNKLFDFIGDMKIRKVYQDQVIVQQFDMYYSLNE
jgi:hypothetical protein